MGGATTAKTSTSPPHAEGTPDVMKKRRRRVAAGTLMGEAAVLYACTRACTVCAEGATVMWTLSRDIFTAVVCAHQPVVRDVGGANDGSGRWAILNTHLKCKSTRETTWGAQWPLAPLACELG